MSKHQSKILAVALNPCIDRGLEVPDLRIGGHQVCRQLFRRAAGKATNLARVLNALKVPTTITGFVGRAQQEYFERQLSGDYLSCQLFAVEGRTRENITIVDPVNNVETHLRDQGFEVTSADMSKLRKKLALICQKDMVVCFSGSLPPGLDLEQFVELVEICQMQGARVCVDSSGKVLRACKPLHLYAIKPNFDELSEMLGENVTGEEQIIPAAEKLAESIDIVLISCGREGGYVFSSADGVCLRGKVSVDPKEIRNTVGCGDALLAGFIAEIVAGEDLANSYRHALAVATAAAVSLAPGEVHDRDIERFLEIVEITTIR